MSNRLTLSDAINEAQDTGKDATFLFGGTLYTFSPQGLIDFIEAVADFEAQLSFTVPTSDPSAAGEVWNDAGVLKVSAG